MTEWWETLQQRERLLVIIAGVLTVAFALILFGFRPALSANAEAKQRHLTASRALDVVTSGLPRLTETATAGTVGVQSLAPEELRRRLTAAAQETGLVVSQLRSAEDGGVGIVLGDTDPRLVFAFVQLLDARDGIRPDRVTMSRTGESDVRVSLEFSAGTS